MKKLPTGVVIINLFTGLIGFATAAVVLYRHYTG